MAPAWGDLKFNTVTSSHWLQYHLKSEPCVSFRLSVRVKEDLNETEPRPLRDSLSELSLNYQVMHKRALLWWILLWEKKRMGNLERPAEGHHYRRFLSVQWKDGIPKARLYTCDFWCDFWCNFACKTRLTLPCMNALPRIIAQIGKQVITYYLKTPLFPISATLAVFCRSIKRLKTRAG